MVGNKTGTDCKPYFKGRKMKILTFPGPWEIIVWVFIAIFVWAFCKIFSKAGYSWANGLLMLIPLVNLFTVLFLAFSEWPIQKELRLMEDGQQTPQLAKLDEREN